jgi:hypothetical protein
MLLGRSHALHLSAKSQADGHLGLYSSGAVRTPWRAAAPWRAPQTAKRGVGQQQEVHGVEAEVRQDRHLDAPRGAEGQGVPKPCQRGEQDVGPPRLPNGLAQTAPRSRRRPVAGGRRIEYPIRRLCEQRASLGQIRLSKHFKLRQCLDKQSWDNQSEIFSGLKSGWRSNNEGRAWLAPGFEASSDMKEV